MLTTAYRTIKASDTGRSKPWMRSSESWNNVKKVEDLTQVHDRGRQRQLQLAVHVDKLQREYIYKFKWPKKKDEEINRTQQRHSEKYWKTFKTDARRGRLTGSTVPRRSVRVDSSSN